MGIESLQKLEADLREMLDSLPTEHRRRPFLERVLNDTHGQMRLAVLEETAVEPQSFFGQINATFGSKLADDMQIRDVFRPANAYANPKNEVYYRANFPDFLAVLQASTKSESREFSRITGALIWNKLYKTIGQLREASAEDLLKIPGVGMRGAPGIIQIIKRPEPQTQK